MEKYSAQIKVTSPSFSRNDVLKRELLASFPNSTFNMSGKELEGKELIDFLSETEGAIIVLIESMKQFLLTVRNYASSQNTA